MNIYEKMNQLKEQFAQTELKKSGKNKFSGFEYFELKDIIPTILKLEKEIGLYSLVTFDKDNATLKFYDTEKPTASEFIVTQVPMITDFEMAKANKVQSMGAVVTYFRRYLYVTALDIVENDVFDAISGKEETHGGYVKKQEFKSKQPTNNAKVEITSKNETGMTDPSKTITSDPHKFVLTFGKENGKTLGQVYKENKGYIKWLSENGKDDAKNAALALLASEELPF